MKEYVFDQSFSGADLKAIINMNGKTRVLGELQTLSFSVHRDKAPVRALGHTYVKGYTRGPLTIGGSLVFTLFNSSVLRDFYYYSIQNPEKKNIDYLARDIKSEYQSELTDKINDLDDKYETKYQDLIGLLPESDKLEISKIENKINELERQKSLNNLLNTNTTNYGSRIIDTKISTLQSELNVLKNNLIKNLPEYQQEELQIKSNLKTQTEQDYINALQEILDNNDSPTKLLTSQIPPFDIIITFNNEYLDGFGNVQFSKGAKLVLFGVDIIDEGQVNSIEDMIIENTFSFVARNVELMNPMLQEPTFNDGDNPTSGSLSKLYTTMSNLNKKYLNPSSTNQPTSERGEDEFLISS
jgi:hypothetical protein